MPLTWTVEEQNVEDPYQLWGIDRNLDLARECANFYLLYDLYRQAPGISLPRFLPVLDQLTQQFAAYTDLAVGGELRHAFTLDNGRIGRRAPAKLRQNAAALSAGSRDDAWVAWKTIRDIHKTAALKWAVSTFNLRGWGSSYGGRAWARIAKTLLDYESGAIEKVARQNYVGRPELEAKAIFVDTCWSLEHNGGNYFNKVWSTSSLRRLLDSVFNHDMAPLLDIAAASVCDYYTTTTKQLARLRAEPESWRKPVASIKFGRKNDWDSWGD